MMTGWIEVNGIPPPPPHTTTKRKKHAGANLIRQRLPAAPHAAAAAAAAPGRDRAELVKRHSNGHPALLQDLEDGGGAGRRPRDAERNPHGLRVKPGAEAGEGGGEPRQVQPLGERAGHQQEDHLKKQAHKREAW